MAEQEKSRKLRLPNLLKGLAPIRGAKTTATDILEEQIGVAIEATELASQVCSADEKAKHARAPMKDIEQEGDSAKDNLLELVATVLTVPLEREDLVRASQSLDDVTDNLRDMVREMAKWKVPPGEWSHDILAPAIDSLNHLTVAITSPNGAKARNACVRAKHHAGKLRRNYQDRLALVYGEELTMDTLKKREVLKRVDSVGSRLADAADALLIGIVKRFL